MIQTLFKHRSFHFGCAFLILWAVLSLPVILNTHPQMVDYFNHLSRQYIRYNMSHFEAFQTTYSYQWMIIPNLANDLLITAFLPFTDIYTAGKITLCIMIGLWLFSPLFLQKILWGKVFLTGFIPALVIYNSMFYWGFTGSMLTAPLAIIVFALWVESYVKNWSFFFAAPLFIALCFLIYVSHLLMFGLLGLLIGGYELGIIIRTKNWSLKNVSKTGAYLALIFGLGIIHFIWHLLHQDISHGTLSSSFATEPLLALILSLVTIGDLSAFAIIMFIALFLYGGFMNKRLFSLSISLSMITPVLLVLCLLFIMPSHILGVYLVSTRFPAIFILLLMATLKVTFHNHAMRYFTIAAFIMLIATLSFNQYKSWFAYNKHIQEFMTVTQTIADGAKILVVFDQPNQLPPYVLQNFSQYWHIGSLLTIEKQTYTPHIFTGMGSFFEVTQQFKAIDSAQPPSITVSKLEQAITDSKTLSDKDQYLSHWPRNFDYIILYTTSKNIPDKLKTFTTLVQRVPNIHLLSISKTLPLD